MAEADFTGHPVYPEAAAGDDVEGDFLREARVAILGLGLMGGSLALRLRGRCQELRGFDPDPDTRHLAEEQRVVDFISGDPGEALAEADLIVLAAPVRAILDLIRRLPDLHPGTPVVLDLGSTKVEICRAFEALPERFHAVGGHPMCGKETSGLAQAEAGLFAGAPFAWVPVANTTQKARQAADELSRAVGAHGLWLDAEVHDRWTAATSHLPYLVSLALTLATPLEAAPLAGSGLHSATRLADSSAVMMQDILRTNREFVFEAMDRLRDKLVCIEKAMRSEEEGDLLALLQQGPDRRRVLIGQKTR